MYNFAHFFLTFHWIAPCGKPCLSVSSDKQLRFIWDTSIGKFCCVNKFRNDDANCCKLKMFPCTISLKVLVFDVPIISSWLILVSQPSQIFNQVRLWNHQLNEFMKNEIPFCSKGFLLLFSDYSFWIFIGLLYCLFKFRVWRNTIEFSLFIFNHKVSLHKFFT